MSDLSELLDQISLDVLDNLFAARLAFETDNSRILGEALEGAIDGTRQVMVILQSMVE